MCDGQLAPGSRRCVIGIDQLADSRRVNVLQQAEIQDDAPFTAAK
jgi:hypothetical protein